MPSDPMMSGDRDRLLAEVRRRATRRRRHRQLGWAGGLGAGVAALAATVALLVPSTPTTSVRVVSPTPSTAPVPSVPATLPPPTTATAITPPVTAPPSPTGAAATSSVPTVSGSGTTTAAPPPTTTQGTAVVPVVVCATDNARSTTAPTQPTTVTLPVAPSTGAALAVYTDELGLLRAVAPRGWTCAADDATDGSAGLAVHPTGVALPAQWSTDDWHPSPGSPVEAVVVAETADCQGCTLGQACPLFSAAATAFDQGFGRPCPTTRPATEEVDRISTRAVAFEDPPGVAGDASPSGGADPANGVMTYSPGDANGSYVETCTLPAGDTATCTTSLDSFLAGPAAR